MAKKHFIYVIFGCWLFFILPAHAQRRLSGEDYYKEAFEKATTIEARREILKQMSDSIFVHIPLAEVKKRLAYQKVSYAFLEEIERTPSYSPLLGYAYMLLASVFRQTDDGKMTAYCYKAYEWARKQQDSFLIDQTTWSLGNRFYTYDERQQALSYYLACEQNGGKMTQHPTLYNTMALCYMSLQNEKQVLAYYEKGLQVARKTNNLAWLGILNGNMSKVYEDRKDYHKAIELLKENIRYCLLDTDYTAHIISSSKLALLYAHIKQPQKGEEAMRLVRTIADTAVRIEQRVPLDSYYQNAYLFYKGIGKTADALYFLEKYSNLQKQRLKDAKEQKTTQIQAQYNVKFKDREITALQKQKQAERWILYLVILVAISLIALAVTLLQNNRKHKKINVLLQENQEEIETQNEALHQLNKMKDKLFSIVSHDFRNPLNALKATAYLMGKANLSQEEIHALTEQAKNQINNTSSFLENLLFWAKSQFKGFQISVEVFDLALILREGIELASPQAQHKQVTLYDDLPASVQVQADQNMLRLIIRNLLSNAIKYCRRGDSVHIKCEILESRVWVKIMDTGVGMSAEQMQTLFTPYVTSTYGTRDEKGAGLGLLLCKDFVERNEGSITVESEEGKGSTFSFDLPITTQATVLEDFVSEEVSEGVMLYKL